MPIATGPSFSSISLKSAILAAFKNARDKGTGSGSLDPDTIVDQLASDISTAIESYVTSCIVTNLPGQTIIGSAAGVPVVGQTVSPGTSGG